MGTIKVTFSLNDSVCSVVAKQQKELSFNSLRVYFVLIEIPFLERDCYFPFDSFEAFPLETLYFVLIALEVTNCGLAYTLIYRYRQYSRLDL